MTGGSSTRTGRRVSTVVSGTENGVAGPSGRGGFARAADSVAARRAVANKILIIE
jgi:hypothetical protein